MKHIKIKVLFYLLALIFSNNSFSIEKNFRIVSNNDDYNIVASYKNENTGNYLAAIKELGVQNNGKFFYHLRMGWLLLLDGKYRNSIEEYSKALSLRPQSVTATIGKANGLSYLGFSEDSVELLRDINKKRPLDLNINLSLVQSLINESKQEDAFELASKLYLYYPENTTLLSYLLFLTKSKKNSDYYKYNNELVLILPQAQTE